MGGTIKQLIVSLVGAVGGCHRDKKQERRMHLQTAELMVRMDCERCERQVKKALAGMRGVEHVEVNMKLQRVTVTGTVDPHKVLRRAQLTGKKVELWPQRPSYSSDAAMAPYRVRAAQAHDRWAPAGYPRNVDAAVGVTAEHITDLFSDDNPNACSVM